MSKQGRSIAPSRFTAPRLVGERFHTDIIQDNRVMSQKLAVSQGTAKGVLTCPHCRLAGHHWFSSYRRVFHSHLEDHKIAKALGIEQVLIEQCPELVHSLYGKKVVDA